MLRCWEHWHACDDNAVTGSVSQVEEEREQAIFWGRRHLATPSLFAFYPAMRKTIDTIETCITTRARKRAVLT